MKRNLTIGAAFLALLAPRLRQRGGWMAAISGAVIALALVPFTPAGVPVVAGALGAVLGAALARRDETPPEPVDVAGARCARRRLVRAEGARPRRAR